MKEKNLKTLKRKDNEIYNKISKLRWEEKLKSKDENIIQNIFSVKKDAGDLENRAKIEK